MSLPGRFGLVFSGPATGAFLLCGLSAGRPGWLMYTSDFINLYLDITYMRIYRFLKNKKVD
jgi:hypothetical protein